MRLDAISIGPNPPHEVNVVIEVPIGGEPIKYEMDKAAGTLVVDRFLYTPMRYPGNYGFIPHIAFGTATPATCWSQTRGPSFQGPSFRSPIGVLRMRDEAGATKIVAVPSSKLTKRYDRVQSWGHAEISIQQIEHFFSHYRISNPESGSNSRVGAMPRMPAR